MKKIDSHVHIDMFLDPYKIISSIEKQNIFAIFMTNLPSYFIMAKENMKQNKNIELALGMHPCYISRCNVGEEMKIIKKRIEDTTYIGEVGLDFSKGYIKNKEIQLKVFNDIMHLLSNKNKIISVHSRNSEKYCLEILKKYRIKNVIFHWYTGDIEFVDKILAEGYYFSINLNFLSNKKSIQLLSRIPKDRILTETDGPYSKYNGPNNKSIELDKTIMKISKIWGCEFLEVVEIVEQNFYRITKNISL